MSTSKDLPALKLGRSSCYCIQVQGKLGAGWKDRLAGMDISIESDAGEHSLTTLTGALRDQAELSGVLNSLFSLHLPIIRVERIQCGPNSNTHNKKTMKKQEK